MELKPLFFTIFKSLNPESYKELSEHRLSSAIKYFFFIIIFSLIIMAILFLPTIWGFKSIISDKAGNFEKLDVNFSFTLKQPFTLVNSPLIKVADSGNLSNEKMLITQDGIYYHSFLWFGNQKIIPFQKSLDLRSESAQSTLNKTFIFLLPSLLFWCFIISIIYFAVLIFVTYILALIFTWFFKISMHALTIFKICIFSATIMILLELILLPFFRLFWIPLVIYWVLLVIVILLLKDELQPHGKSNIYMQSKTNQFKSSKKDDIVDVDDSGNLKSSKRKRSFEEENDGYVELK